MGDSSAEVIGDYSRDVRRAIAGLPLGAIRDVADFIRKQSKRELFLTAGNGGSAANALHISAHLVELGYRSHCLNANPVAVSAFENDRGHDDAFLPFIQFRDADVTLVLFSGSGRSRNMARLAQSGRETGAIVIGLLGAAPQVSRGAQGDMASLCAMSILVPATTHAVAEDCHAVIDHMLTTLLRIA